MALAIALDVAPMWLLLPDRDQYIYVSKTRAWDRKTFIYWLHGEEPLPDMDDTEFRIAERLIAWDVRFVKPIYKTLTPATEKGEAEQTIEVPEVVEVPEVYEDARGDTKS